MATKSSYNAAEAILRLEPTYQGTISRNIRSVMDESLTHLQIQALFLLNDIGPLAMNEISNKLHMSKQHLTRFVDSLVKRGLLERFQRAGNRRTVYIRITAAGEQALENYITYAIGIVAEHFDNLPEDDKTAIADAANIMTDIFIRLSEE